MKKSTMVIIACLFAALLMLAILRSASKPGSNQIGEVSIGKTDHPDPDG